MSGNKAELSRQISLYSWSGVSTPSFSTNVLRVYYVESVDAYKVNWHNYNMYINAVMLFFPTVLNVL